MINPTSDEGKIDPVTQIMITMQWDPASNIDMDLWVMGPENAIVGFTRKEAGYMHLDRDDLGSKNDTFELDGSIIVIHRNIETVFINDIVPGEYFVNVHYFGPSSNASTALEETTIQIFDMRPFLLVYDGTKPSTYKQEITVVSFVVDENGNISSQSENIQRLIKPISGAERL